MWANRKNDMRWTYVVNGAKWRKEGSQGVLRDKGRKSTNKDLIIKHQFIYWVSWTDTHSGIKGVRRGTWVWSSAK